MSGVEWLIEASGCDEAGLRDARRLNDLFDAVVRAMDLHPIGDPHWHSFPVTGGVTGVWLLAESHLAIHTFPEFGSLCLNLFCCRERPPLDWQACLRDTLGAVDVRVTEVRRHYAAPRRSRGVA